MASKRRTRVDALDTFGWAWCDDLSLTLSLHLSQARYANSPPSKDIQSSESLGDLIQLATMLISKQNRRIIYENLFKGPPFRPTYRAI